MNTLVINPGSTAVKYTVFSDDENELEKVKFSFLKTDVKKNEKFLGDLGDIEKIGIRIVHGGDLRGPVLIDKKVLNKIKEFEIFAPIHNKLALVEIKKIQKIFKGINIYAVFDTDFHKTIPEENYTIPINQNIAKKYKIRKYGFHGIAVQSIVNQLKKIFKNNKKKLPKNIIAVHLGGGSSVTAVKNGKSFITSMGLTPISGLMMKTRVGEIDSDVDKILAKLMSESVEYISDLFSTKSGFLGLTGSVDTKKIIERAQEEIKEKKGKYKKELLAFNIYLNSIVQKIYAYTGAMGGVDKIVFSGGIGEGNTYLRNQVLKKLKLLKITKKDIFVVNVDEERNIYQQIKKL